MAPPTSYSEHRTPRSEDRPMSATKAGVLVLGAVLAVAVGQDQGDVVSKQAAECVLVVFEPGGEQRSHDLLVGLTPGLFGALRWCGRGRSRRCGWGRCRLGCRRGFGLGARGLAWRLGGGLGLGGRVIYSDGPMSRPWAARKTK